MGGKVKMNNFYNYINELFTKPQVLWSVADKVIFAILTIIVVCIIAVIILVICGIVEEIKRRKKGKKK